MKRNNVLIGISLVGVLALASCGGKKQQQTAEEEKIQVQAMTAGSREVDQLGTFTATVEAEITNNIAPQQSGRIKKIFVEIGDHVSRGQKLAEMDAANLNQGKLRMENDQIEFERVDELYKVGGISKSEWDARKLAYELSKESYENLQENTFLRSPISGIVTKRNYDTGDMYGMGQPLFVVEQIQPVKVIVNVSEGLYTKVKRGMGVGVTLDVYGDEEFKGTVSLIHPSVDPGTRTFPVEVQIRNSGERILPGMFARVTFNYGTANHVVVSDRAIQKQTGSGDRYVYVCENGVAKYRKVELGRRLDAEYEVLSGLEEGDVVAITGQNRLSDGTEVEIVKPFGSAGAADVAGAREQTDARSDSAVN